MAGPIRSPKTRAWEDKSLSDIAGQIAGEAGLTPAVHPSLRATRWPYVAQTSESDLHLLTRLAREIGAVAKPAGGMLSVTPRGAATNAAGTTMPKAALTPGDFDSYDWAIGEREQYACVEAEWQETATGQTRTVRAGSGEPKRKLRHCYGSEAEASRAATAQLAAAAQGAMILRAKCTAFEPGLFAGGTLALTGLRPELSGDWLITQVVHELASGGLKTQLTAKKPAPKKGS